MFKGSAGGEEGVVDNDFFILSLNLKKSFSVITLLV